MVIVEEKIALENLFTLGSLRKRLGLSVEEVSEYMGLSVYKVTQLEKDSTDLGVDLAKKFAKLYCVPFHVIFFGRELTFSKELREKGGYAVNK